MPLFATLNEKLGTISITFKNVEIMNNKKFIRKNEITFHLLFIVLWPIFSSIFQYLSNNHISISEIAIQTLIIAVIMPIIILIGRFFKN